MVNDYRLSPSFTGQLFEQGADRMICAHNINVPEWSCAHAHTHKGSFRCVEAQWSSGREGSAKRKRLCLSIVAERKAWVRHSDVDMHDHIIPPQDLHYIYYKPIVVPGMDTLKQAFTDTYTCAHWSIHRSLRGGCRDNWEIMTKLLIFILALFLINDINIFVKNIALGIVRYL